MDKLNWTGVRRELVSDNVWYRSIGYEFRKAAGVDDEIKSVAAIDSSGAFSLLTIQRNIGATPFDVHESRLVEFIHKATIGILKRPRPAFVPMPELTGVLQATLRLAVQGKSDNEIASALQRSARTVNENMQRLYERFQVENRKELLAFFTEPSVLGDLHRKSRSV